MVVSVSREIATPPPSLPDFLTHYYEASIGPYVNLSDLPLDKAEAYLEQIRLTGKTFASQRPSDYLTIRRELEDQVRALFVQKGGRPKRKRPHYMILGKSPWLLDWYQQGKELRIPIENFSAKIISFTYGDTFPAMRYQDDKPYRGKVFLLEELPQIVLQFGLPQKWNPDGHYGPDRYIEAQIWDDEPLRDYITNKG